MRMFFERTGNKEIKNPEKDMLYAGCKGELIPLQKVKDEVFSSGIMGDGIAVIPEKQMIIAPMSGTILTVFPTKHAIAMLCENGAELVIHIGIETVALEGKYFDCIIKEGDHVKAGEDIVKVQFHKIKKEGYDTTVIYTIVNSCDYTLEREFSGSYVDYGTPLIRVKRRSDL